MAKSSPVIRREWILIFIARFSWLSFFKALSWTIANVSQYGGDPERVHVMGQSAGSHLVLMAAIDQAARESFIYVREKGMFSSSSYQHLASLEHSAPKEKISHPNRIRLTPLRHTPPRSDLSLSGQDGHLGGDDRDEREKKNALARSLSLSGSRPPEGWRLSNIRSLLLLSGPFDICNLIPHLHQRFFFVHILSLTYGHAEGSIARSCTVSWRVKSPTTHRTRGFKRGPFWLVPMEVMLPHAWRWRYISGKRCNRSFATNLSAPWGQWWNDTLSRKVPFDHLSAKFVHQYLSIRMREVLEDAHVDVHLKIYKGRNHTDAVFEACHGEFWERIAKYMIEEIENEKKWFLH